MENRAHKKMMRRFFGLADFIKEQEFLQEQHRQGWVFKHFDPMFKYSFEKGEPGDFVYQLDYKENEKDEESYIQMFRDCGWEYIMKYGMWYYFKKEKTENDKENSIFSDRESRIEMCKRVSVRNALLIVPVFVIFLSSASALLHLERSLLRNLLLAFMYLPMLIAFGTVIQYAVNFVKLTNMMKKIKRY